MVNYANLNHQPALMFLGDGIPAVGLHFEDKDVALQVVREYVATFGRRPEAKGQCYPYSVQFRRQGDGRYTLILSCGSKVVHTLGNVDEIMLRRFCQGFKRKLFILTTFCDGPAGELECLALSEGLGAVLLTFE